MKDNKLYKVLRIVFLTLAIISLIFSLSKKFVHAEGRQYTSYPLPVGFDGYGVGGQLTPEIANNIINQTKDIYPNCAMITVNEIRDNGYIWFNVYFSLPTFNVSGNTSNLYYPSSISYGNSNGVGKNYKIRTGEVNASYETSLYPGDVYPSNYVLPNPVVGEEVPTAYLIKTFIPNYPLYINPDLDSTPYQGVFILSEPADPDTPSYSGSSIGGSGSGTFIPSGDSGGDTSSGGSFDFDLDLEFDGSAIIHSIDGGFLTIGGQIESLQGSVDGLGSSIGGLSSKIDSSNSKLDQIKGELQSLKGSLVDSSDNKSWLEKIFLKIKEIYDYISEPFNQTKFNNGVQSLPISQDINTIKGDLNTFKNSFDVSPDNGDNLVFEIPFTLPYIDLEQTAVIDFRLYENIRNIVEPFLVAFVCFGMVWSLIRSIPGIFHGTSPDGDS